MRLRGQNKSQDHIGPWRQGRDRILSQVPQKAQKDFKQGFSITWFIFFTSFWLFPCGSAGKESTHNAEDLGSIPGLQRSPGEEKGYPLQYSRLENSMYCIVLGVTKTLTQLSKFHFHFSLSGYCRKNEKYKVC